MHNHKEAQEGRVELNIGGYRFETAVQTLRRVPHTFSDAYFSGRYAQDVCNDGSIFVDRCGEHFGHILEYVRGGVVSVAEADARPSVSSLRALKREFGFYCIELKIEELPDPPQSEMAGMELMMMTVVMTIVVLRCRPWSGTMSRQVNGALRLQWVLVVTALVHVRSWGRST
jgi:hypothetical protein